MKRRKMLRYCTALPDADLDDMDPDFEVVQPFDAHCCHTGIAIKHHVPSFVIFDIRAL